MKMENIICDRCNNPVNSPKDGVTSFNLRLGGNGWAETTLIEHKDYCGACSSDLCTILAKFKTEMIKR